MHNELRLLWRTVGDRDIRALLDCGVNRSWFVEPQAAELWDVVYDHYRRYSAVPSPATVRNELAARGVPLTPVTVDEGIDYLLDTFIADYRNRRVKDLITEVVEEIGKSNDHEAALRRLSSESAQLLVDGGRRSSETDLTQGVEERIAEYMALRDSVDGGLIGLPTGFPTIDRATMGLQPEQLVTLIATAKTGKSLVSLCIARNIHEHGSKPLLVTYEMSVREEARRFDALVSGVAHRKLLNGQISALEERLLKSKLKALYDSVPFIVVDDPSVRTVPGLLAKAEQHQPDVVLVDGVYLMQDEQSGEQNTPRALTNLTRNLKQAAQRTNIPWFISTQALTWKLSKGKTLTADAAGYSSSFYQDSDVMLGLQRGDEADDGNEERTLKILASRNCPRLEVPLIWDWEMMIFREGDSDAD